MWSIAMWSTLMWSTCHEINSIVYISNAVKNLSLCPIRECSDDCLQYQGPMERRASTTEFIAEGISIHDPNPQEVKPTSVTFKGLFISEWSCRVVGVECFNLILSFNFWKAQFLIEPNSNHKPESRILVLFCGYIWQINLSSASLNY